MANATTLDIREIQALYALDDKDGRLSMEIADEETREWYEEHGAEFIAETGEEVAKPPDDFWN